MGLNDSMTTMVYTCYLHAIQLLARMGPSQPPPLDSEGEFRDNTSRNLLKTLDEYSV